MKKINLALVSLLTLFVLGACGQDKEDSQTPDKLQVVATNSILADMAEIVGGDKVEVHSIVPVGTDPHEYEPLPVDIAKSTEADLIFYNGLNLETGGSGWFAKLMETSNKKAEVDFFAASLGVEPMYLTSDGKESEQDPHAWLDISNGMTYVRNIEKALAAKDAGNEAYFKAKADTYIAALEELDTKGKKEFKEIPKEQALLVTSEGAFKYFSKAYGLEAAYIWEINTESQGTPDQMSQIIDKINETKVPNLFIETSVDPRSMESVSNETGIPIYDKIFTDSLANKGEPGDSYYKMMEWNLTKIHDGLLAESK
ncbi:metal ABC transporter substrate-binding protein [Vagococcus sp. BWB3-3]|uniref:Metal ABC transporter substrate-binding protein n=1 Tax=Vagococcus allomyrinae TaxID=2794353 RepID=A0A940SQN2_9ENTE|nr:metal ABC transporter substrate-binding protein [Vagococcus allomyrinae]MBP1039897.1 metal ABC transporter substrate-binding protein [Vagococcus allomyrinae]